MTYAEIAAIANLPSDIAEYIATHKPISATVAAHRILEDDEHEDAIHAYRLEHGYSATRTALASEFEAAGLPRYPDPEVIAAYPAAAAAGRRTLTDGEADVYLGHLLGREE